MYEVPENPEDMVSLEKEIMRDPDARAAYMENSLRRVMAEVFKEAIKEKGLPKYYFFRHLGISQTQAFRLLQKEVGGSLSLFSICRAADALGLEVSLNIKPISKSPARIRAKKNTSIITSLNHENYRG
jgi:hypothetical protein